ncbi:MAG: hypothetical protein R6X12_10575 [bacterium]
MLSTELAGPADLSRLELLCASAEYDSGVYHNFRLLLCLTSRAELIDNYADNYDGNAPMLVRGDDLLEVGWVNGEWDGFDFDSSFAYDGASNLLIEFRWQGTDGRAVYDRGWYPPGGNRTLDGYSLTSPTGELRPYSVCLRVHFLPAGVAERPAAGGAAPLPTVARGALFLAGDRPAELRDAAGRVAARLAPGANDVSRLAPGVYFVAAGARARRLVIP